MPNTAKYTRRIKKEALLNSSFKAPVRLILSVTGSAASSVSVLL
jgi:hypothetical protein